MNLQIIQNQIGNYRILPNEKILIFSMGIFEKGILVRNGNLKAEISFWISENIESEMYGLKTYFENFEIEEILKKNKEYLVDKGCEKEKNNTNFFIDLFIKNQDLILENFKKDRIENFQKEIERTKFIISIDEEDIEYFKK